MFFGLSLISNLAIEPKIPKETILHITNIAYIAKTKKDKAFLYVKKDNIKFLIASLDSTSTNLTIKFKFNGNDKLKFLKEGKGPIHLTGYLKSINNKEKKQPPKNLRLEKLINLQNKIKLSNSRRKLNKKVKRSYLKVNEILAIDTDSETEKNYFLKDLNKDKIPKNKIINSIDITIGKSKNNFENSEKHNNYSEINKYVKSVNSKSNNTKTNKNLQNKIDTNKSKNSSIMFSSINKLQNTKNELKELNNKIKKKEKTTKNEIILLDNLLESIPNLNKELIENKIEPKNEDYTNLIDQQHEDDFEGMEEEDEEVLNKTTIIVQIQSQVEKKNTNNIIITNKIKTKKIDKNNNSNKKRDLNSTAKKQKEDKFNKTANKIDLKKLKKDFNSKAKKSVDKMNFDNKNKSNKRSRSKKNNKPRVYKRKRRTRRNFPAEES